MRPRSPNSTRPRRGCSNARPTCAALGADGVPLPTLAPRLNQWRHDLLEGRGFLLLRGLPIERYTHAEAAAIFLGLGAHLGRARSQNAKGHVLGHVCDLGLASSDPNVRIYQTRERQTFHTDSCDIVGLLCLREARSGGDSLLVSALTRVQRTARARAATAGAPAATDGARSPRRSACRPAALVSDAGLQLVRGCAERVLSAPVLRQRPALRRRAAADG